MKRQRKRQSCGYKIILAILLGLAALGIFYLQAQKKEQPIPKETDVAILGSAEVSQAKMVEYIKKRNQNPKLNCSVEALVQFYYEEAQIEGVRADLALCQAIKETGCFSYGGDVVPEQNNYCGLGTTGNGVKGNYFSSPREGVRAHIQHLLAYASTRPPKQKIVDPRYELLKEKRPEIFGKVTTWIGLNGVWAVPGKTYGQDILTMLVSIKSMK